MNVARWCVLVCACVLLAACGGGGGAGGRSSQFRITLDRTSLTFDAYEGTSTGNDQTIIATATGDFEGTLYLGAIIEGQGVRTPIVLTIDGNNRGTIAIAPDTSLPPGQYTSRVQALACSDPACGNRVGGTPITITCNVTIRRGVAVSMDYVYLSSVEGTTATSRPITVKPAENIASFSVVPLPGSPWIHVADVTATSFRLVAGPRPTGRHFGIVDVNGGPSSRRITVDYTSADEPGKPGGVYASPDTLTFNLPSGMQESKAISVAGPFETDIRTAISYELPSNGNWLTLSGTNSTFTVNASAAGLTNGRYTAVIHFNTGFNFQGMDMVAVTLNVGPTLTATVPDIYVTSSTTAANLAVSSTVGSLGGVTGDWTATSSTPWLTLTRSSGAVGTNVEFAIRQQELAALANLASYEGSIHLTSSAGATAIDVPLMLHKRIGQVTSVGPALQFSGRPLRTVIRGRGFMGMTDLAQRIRITGATTDSMTLVNDNAVILATPALAAGDYSVGITNALGLPTTTATLRVLNPTFPAYAVVPSSARPQSVFVDPQRASVYGIRNEQAELVRYRLQSGNWQSNTFAVPQLYSAGMSNDGSNLLVSSAPGRLTYRDPDTFAERSSFDSPEDFQNPLGNFSNLKVLPVSNDDRVWFAVREPRSGLLTYFDPATSSFHRPGRSPLPIQFDEGPRIDISRDGLRLIVNAPLHTLSSADDELVRIEHLGACGSVVTNDDGSRTLCFGRVYDSAWQPGPVLHISEADQTSGWIGGPGFRPTLLSPSGEFAYGLAFHTADYNFDGGPEPTPTHPLRVYVFDLSGDAPSEVLESSTFFEFDGLDYPSCRIFNVSTCLPLETAAISPDGNTLYYIGDRNLIVVPIPAQFR